MDINFIYLRSKITTDHRFLDKEKNNFLNSLNSNNDFNFSKNGINIFFIETGGTEEEFESIYKNYKEPYYLLATNANNSLPASLEITSFLNKNNAKFHLFHGTSEEIRKQLLSIKEINEYSNNLINLKVKVLVNKRYGVVGKPSNWLISSNVDYKLAKSKFGVELIDISFSEFSNEINNANDIIYASTFRKYLNEKIDEETLTKALKIYSALRNLIVKYNLNGLTVRCFDLLESYKNTSCLALAILNKDGYIATCEGDIPTMLSMAFIRETFHESSFQVNPSYINEIDRYGYFAHCTLPLDMCLSYEFDTHFESGLGVAIKGRLNLGNVTIFKLNSSLDRFEVFEGKISANLHQNNLCRTQIKVIFNEDIDSLLHAPLGNHLVICYGAHKKEIINLLD